MSSAPRACRTALALLALTVAGCTAQVAVRPTTPAAAHFGAPADETVGLYASPDFTGRVAQVQSGPTTLLFDLGRGGAPMVQEILQARFSRILAVPHLPPLAPGEQAEVTSVLVPSWNDFGAVQLDPQGTFEADAVIELALLRRDGRAVWTRSFSGKGRGVVTPGGTGGMAPEAALAAIANQALEQAGAALATELAQPQVVASVSEVREQAEAQARSQQQGEARKQARRLLVHPFAGQGPLAASAAGLQGEVVTRLTGSGRVVVVASGETQQQLDAAVRQVNREGVDEAEWVRLGQGRGAELLLGGEVISAGGACSVKVELTDLGSRLVLASFFRSLPQCSAQALLELAEPAAQAVLGGL